MLLAYPFGDYLKNRRLPMEAAIFVIQDSARSILFRGRNTEENASPKEK